MGHFGTLSLKYGIIKRNYGAKPYKAKNSGDELKKQNGKMLELEGKLNVQRLGLFIYTKVEYGLIKK